MKLSRLWIVVACLCWPVSLAVAVDVVFKDGAVWPDVKIRAREIDSVIVSNAQGIHTVRVTDVTPECALALGIRELTAEEIAARNPAPAAPPPPPAPAPTVSAPVTASNSGNGPQAVASTAPVIVNNTIVNQNSQTVVAGGTGPRELYFPVGTKRKFNGKIVRREPGKGALVVAESGLTGMLYLYEDAKLTATTAGGPVGGDAYFCGFVTIDGRRVPAWSFQPRL